jgi:hypothetical protein
MARTMPAIISAIRASAIKMGPPPWDSTVAVQSRALASLPADSRPCTTNIIVPANKTR